MPAWGVGQPVVVVDSDEVIANVRFLLDSGVSPIEAIKTVREEFEMDLGDAKALVHRELTPEQQQGAEALWDATEDAARQDDP